MPLTSRRSASLDSNSPCSVLVMLHVSAFMLPAVALRWARH